jgi:FkbM family methyltransferase
LRAWANGLPDNKLARVAMSAVRDILGAGRNEPFDVTVFGELHARLYPTTNRCEKRMFVGERSFDAPERAAIAQALRNADRTRPFVFVDGGANVGLYSLYAIAEARRLNWPIRVICVEPDPVNLARLRDNLAASAAHEASVAPVALGAEKGVAMLESDQTNRGEVHVSASGTVEVAMEPLAAILTDRAVDHVDALKLDIEGHELPVLTSFFETAPRSLWPKLILLEVTKHGDTPAYDLCLEKGYRLDRRLHINALLKLEG